MSARTGIIDLLNAHEWDGVELVGYVEKRYRAKNERELTHAVLTEVASRVSVVSKGDLKTAHAEVDNANAPTLLAIVGAYLTQVDEALKAK